MDIATIGQVLVVAIIFGLVAYLVACGISDHKQSPLDDDKKE